MVSRNAEGSAAISNCLQPSGRDPARDRDLSGSGARAPTCRNNTLKCRRIVREEPDAAKASDARQNRLSVSAAGIDHAS